VNKHYPNLFKPITVRGVTFRNRIIVAPHFLPCTTAEHYPDDDFIRFFEDKAKGGAAAVTIDGVSLDIDPPKPPTVSWLSLDTHSITRMLKLSDAIRQHGAVATCQLAHGGLGVPGFDGGGPIGPSSFTRPDGVQVREMTTEQMKLIADSFGRAAAFLVKCGFNMIQLHGGHGALFTQFFSPDTNRRTDEYGGSLENRIRYPVMIIERVREAIGDNIPIEFRMSGDEFTPGGYDIAEGVEIAKLIQNKVDILHISAARVSNIDTTIITHPTIFRKNGCNAYLAAAIKKAVQTPVAVIGGITTPELAEEILADGKADFIAMARALIADPAFPNKARLGRQDEIMPCLRCLNCLSEEETQDTFHCSINPFVGCAFRTDHIPKKTSCPQIVAVVGGGVAGMVAATTAASRGHRVTLFERTGELGGILKFTDRDSIKLDLNRYKNYLIDRTCKIGVDIRLNTEATPELISDITPDTVITAVGSAPSRPPIPGLAENAIHVLDVYADNAINLGKKLVIIGGGLAGCETAVELARKGHEVIIIEMQDDIAKEGTKLHGHAVRYSVRELGIKVFTNAVCREVLPDGVAVTLPDGRESFIEADEVLFALGMTPNKAAAEMFDDCAPNVIKVGDCVEAKQVGEAVYSATYAILDLD